MTGAIDFSLDEQQGLKETIDVATVYHHGVQGQVPAICFLLFNHFLAQEWSSKLFVPRKLLRQNGWFGGQFGWWFQKYVLERTTVGSCMKYHILRRPLFWSLAMLDLERWKPLVRKAQGNWSARGWGDVFKCREQQMRGWEKQLYHIIRIPTTW